MLNRRCLLLAFTLAAGACAGDSQSITDEFVPVSPTAASTTAPAADPSTTEPADTTAAEQSTTTEATPETTEAITPWTEATFTLAPVGTFDQPIYLTTRSGSDELFVAMREGTIARFEPDRSDQATDILDITDRVGTDGEGGLLSAAFSPEGTELYVSFTNTEGDSVLEAYDVSGTDSDIDLDSRRVLLEVNQPFSNHNGGQLAFGPDGFLYFALGDGGSANDPQGNGQDPTTLLGTILRIDPSAPDGDRPYGIPADNPFVESPEAGQPEVWIYGVRNPWRFSFDRTTGDLWIADVGQNAIEEVDLLFAADGGGRGANLGWAAVEGNEPVGGASAPSDHVSPVFTYSHETGGCSITGGYVYRGDRMPSLDGVYVFGDYCSGEVAGLALGDVAAPLGISTDRNDLVSFGQGPDGELYVIEVSGQISRIEQTFDTIDG